MSDTQRVPSDRKIQKLDVSEVIYYLLVVQTVTSRARIFKFRYFVI